MRPCPKRNGFAPPELDSVCGRVTALMHAAVKGHMSVVELLIAAGADLAAKANNG